MSILNEGILARLGIRICFEEEEEHFSVPGGTTSTYTPPGEEEEHFSVPGGTTASLTPQGEEEHFSVPGGTAETLVGMENSTAVSEPSPMTSGLGGELGRIGSGLGFGLSGFVANGTYVGTLAKAEPETTFYASGGSVSSEGKKEHESWINASNVFGFSLAAQEATAKAAVGFETTVEQAKFVGETIGKGFTKLAGPGAVFIGAAKGYKDDGFKGAAVEGTKSLFSFSAGWAAAAAVESGGLYFNTSPIGAAITFVAAVGVGVYVGFKADAALSVVTVKTVDATLNNSQKIGQGLLSTAASNPASFFGPSTGFSYGRPIILDLTGNGIKITQKSQSGMFFDMAGDGYQHHTAWAGAGNGVLVLDIGNTGKITQQNQVVFTKWDPTAQNDMQALRDVFDTNHNGKLDAGDAHYADFKILVTNADGTMFQRAFRHF